MAKGPNLQNLKNPVLLRFLGIVVSFCIVALGQPVRAGWLGAVAAVAGFCLFFFSLPQNRRFLIGTAWFTLVQLVQLSWMTAIEFQGYYILLVYAAVALGIGCQFGLLTICIPSSGKISFSRILSLAALWTIMEWIRLFVACGFSWNPIGLALTHYAASMQFASVFGIYGLSFWVMLVNLLVLNSCRMKGKALALPLCLACIPYLFGWAHLTRVSNNAKALDVALIQTAWLPSQKTPHPDRMQEFVEPIEQWWHIFKSVKENPHCDLIALPEAAVPLQSDFTFYRYADAKRMLMMEFGLDVVQAFPPLKAPFAEQRVLKNEKIWCVSNLFFCQTLANLYRSEVVAGLDHADALLKKNFNSAFYFKPGSVELDRYDKQILLPLGEYLPFEWMRSWTKSYGIFDFFSHGAGTKIFGEKIPFSVSICYEETFPSIMRDARAKGAELFVNLTNDNYYPHSTLHEQHFFHARLRAVENGIPLIRACNAGITAVVDHFGQKKAALGTAEGVLNHRLTIERIPTLFALWGDGGIIALCLSIFLFSWRSKTQT
jgi:apolipoprotein N-acyltransferase